MITQAIDTKGMAELIKQEKDLMGELNSLPPIQISPAEPVRVSSLSKYEMQFIEVSMRFCCFQQSSRMPLAKWNIRDWSLLNEASERESRVQSMACFRA